MISSKAIQRVSAYDKFKEERRNKNKAALRKHLDAITKKEIMIHAYNVSKNLKLKDVYKNVQELPLYIEKETLMVPKALIGFVRVELDEFLKNHRGPYTIYNTNEYIIYRLFFFRYPGVNSDDSKIRFYEEDVQYHNEVYHTNGIISRKFKSCIIKSIDASGESSLHPFRDKELEENFGLINNLVAGKINREREREIYNSSSKLAKFFMNEPGHIATKREEKTDEIIGKILQYGAYIAFALIAVSSIIVLMIQ